MKIAEIIKLRTLGYSKEEVQAFIEAEKEPPAPEPTPEPAPAPAPEPTPEPAPAPAPEPTPEDNILTAINNLTRAIQSSNIIRDEQPKKTEETAEDILNNVLEQI